MVELNEQEARDKVFGLIKDIKIALMVTHSTDGKLRSRPMSAVKREGNLLLFMTRDDSGKIEDLLKDSEVLLAYSEPKSQSYVSISGKASVDKDRAKITELWSEFMRTWFPKGKDDPSIALIRVEAQTAEYWDSSSSAIVYAYGYLKARLTGESPKELADTGHVEFPQAF